MNIAADGALATMNFPASPIAGDAVYVTATGASVSNSPSLNPNGNHVINPLTNVSSASAVTMGPNVPAGALFIFETSGTLWRQVL